MFRRMAGKHRTQDQRKLQTLLKDVRVQSGLTQVQMASALGRPQSYVSKYESGERKLDLLELRDICESAGIGLSEFARRFEH